MNFYLFPHISTVFPREIHRNILKYARALCLAKYVVYLFCHCGALRAFFNPYFFRSTILASLVINPARRKRFLKSALNLTRALAIAFLTACAWAFMPPP